MLNSNSVLPFENLPDNNSEEQYEQLVLNHYSQEPHWNVNKLVAKKLGIENAIFLSYLFFEFQNFQKNNKLDADGYFDIKRDTREDDTGLSFHKQRQAIEALEKSGILYPVIRKGTPAKQWFKFNFRFFWDFLNHNSHLPSRSILCRQVVPSFAYYSNTVLLNSNTVVKESKDSLIEGSFGELPSQTPSNRFQRLAPIPPPPKEEPKETSDYIQKATGEYAVLLSWNKLPRPACPHVKFNTKTVQRAVEYLTQMRHGGFGDPSRRLWDKNWIDKRNFDLKTFAEKKWSFREICKTIEGPLADMYKEKFWPPDKSTLPKSLDDALYNRHTQSSFFVLAYYKPPGSPVKYQDTHSKITEALGKMGISTPSTIGDWKRYAAGLQGLEKSLKTINWKNYGARQMFPSGERGELSGLVMAYVKWLKGRDYPELLPPPGLGRESLEWSILRPDFWGWRKFMVAVNTYWGNVFKEVEVEED